MLPWHTIPLLRLLIPFVLGIVVAVQAHREYHIRWWVFLLLFLVLSAFLRWPKILFPYRYRWVMGAFIHLLLFLMGMELTIRHVSRRDADHFIRFSGKDSLCHCIGIIDEDVVVKDKTVKVVLSVRLVDHRGLKHTSGRGIIYMEKDSLSGGLEYGDILEAEAKWQEIRPPRNPFEFDFRKYLSRKGIYNQTYIKSGHWKLMAHNGGSFLYKTASSWRRYLLGVLRKNGLSGDELEVGGAILLGEYQNFDPELLRAYSGAGVTHILSVSGLHVGIVFFVFNSLLFFLNRNRRTKLIKAILLILMTWFYALLTGISPPVERAAAMFTFIIVGQAIHRKSHILNTLSASAFLLLLLNPFLITDIGFQLTYLAVAGIVIMEKPVYELFIMPNKWMDKVWKLVAVTIAAQLTTGPLAVYYFHQFPVYFIPANLIIIPWSTVVMYSGMAALAFSPLGVPGNWLTTAFAWSILVMNRIIQFIEHLPWAVAGRLTVSIGETLLVYLLIIIMAMFLIRKRGFLLMAGLSIFLVLCISVALKNYNRCFQEKFLVYDIKKNFAMGFIEGKKEILVADSVVLSDMALQKRYFENARIQWGIKEKQTRVAGDSLPLQTAYLWRSGKFFQFCGKRILLIDKSLPGKIPQKPLRIDYLVVRGNPKMTVGAILHFYKPGWLIFSADNSKRRVLKWQAECKLLGISYYNTSENGAFTEEIR